MKIHWLLQTCIALAVGVGLVSCTKDQLDQLMTHPGDLIQSSSCQTAGVSSTTTPEFCVNVTEIKLLNHDTQADVSLTLVNRTGRRLFLALSSSPYLTDSSGGKWDKQSVTGIGFVMPGNVPVPLEPNVETQVSFLFRPHGQAPSDLTFSMHGEIAIMKVDSRGQASPLKIEVKRGFNLSGIRIQQQPPQSGGPAEQNLDTKHAQVSPRGVDSATSKAPLPSDTISAAVVSDPIAIDVVGLRLGMSPSEVEKVFKQRHLDNGILQSRPTNESMGVGKTLKVFTFRDIATGQDIKVKDSEYVSSMRGIYDPGPSAGAKREEIRAQFTPLHNREQLVIIWRQQYYSAGNQPATDTFLKSLQDKYGPIMAKSGCDINGTDCSYIWHYKQDGEPIQDISSECISYGKNVGGYIYNVPDIENKSNKCGSILVKAHMSARNGLVNSVVIVAHNVELDLSTFKEANDIVAAAEKEKADRQMQKARTQKPDF